jgi:hypothetical protein
VGALQHVRAELVRRCKYQALRFTGASLKPMRLSGGYAGGRSCTNHLRQYRGVRLKRQRLKHLPQHPRGLRTQGVVVDQVHVVSLQQQDLLVHSAAPATLEQVQALEALLKAHPSANPAHVKLGKLAIHANLFGVDCDIVCADTVEYGARPPVDERVALDPVISSTACALKLWAEKKQQGWQITAPLWDPPQRPATG